MATRVPPFATQRLACDGLVGPDDTVVAIGGSTGLDHIGATASRLDEVPVIEPTLRALAERMQRVS